MADADSTLEPAPADEEHPPGASDEEDDSDKEGHESNSGANDELGTLDVDDDFDEGEEPVPFEIPTGHALASSARMALTAELIKRPIVLRLGIGWLKGAITMAGSSVHPPALRPRVFGRPRRQHTQREAAVVQVLDGRLVAGGSWALLEGLAGTGGSDRWVCQRETGKGRGEVMIKEDEEEDEEDDRINDAEAVERSKGKVRAKRKRVTLGEGVASTARSSSRACMPSVRLTDQQACAVK